MVCTGYYCTDADKLYLALRDGAHLHWMIPIGLRW